jgi:hypothetical protein
VCENETALHFRIARLIGRVLYFCTGMPSEQGDVRRESGGSRASTSEKLDLKSQRFAPLISQAEPSRRPAEQSLCKDLKAPGGSCEGPKQADGRSLRARGEAKKRRKKKGSSKPMGDRRAAQSVPRRWGNAGYGTLSQS